MHQSDRLGGFFKKQKLMVTVDFHCSFHSFFLNASFGILLRNLTMLNLALKLTISAFLTILPAHSVCYFVHVLPN